MNETGNTRARKRIDHAAASELLPFYASGSLAEGEHCAVAAHLVTCAACREELDLWLEAGRVVAEAAAAQPGPSAEPLLGALSQIRRATPLDKPAGVRPVTALLSNPRRAQSLSPRPRPRVAEPVRLDAWPWEGANGALALAGNLLQAQVPLVRRELWPTSALAMALGLVVAFIVPAADQAGAVVGAIAPLIAAAGVALVSDPENDPALELTLATPTLPRQVMLARMALVYGYDFALALAATVALVAIVPPSLLGGIALGWLGPMALLAALALVLSLKLGTGGAVGISFSLWLSRWIGHGAFTASDFVPDGLASIARASDATWANTPLLLASACVLVVVAVWLAGRQEPLSTP